jgi:GTPase SAR1 family protein
MEERTDENEFCHVDVAVNGVPMTLQLWDISEDPRCYKDAHALVMVFDLTNRGSFAALDGYWKFFTRYAGVREGSHFPCVLVGNKCDLNLKRPIPQDQINAFCRKQSPSQPIPYVEVSAEREINLDELFKLLSLAAYTSFAVGELSDDMLLPILNAFRPTEERKSSTGGCQPCGGLSSFLQTLFHKEPTSSTSGDGSAQPRRRSF